MYFAKVSSQILAGALLIPAVLFYSLKGDTFRVDFDELKIHRKSSIYYDPVKNPYGAPPAGQALMYRHPDGSIKKEPPPLSKDELAAHASAACR